MSKKQLTIINLRKKIESGFKNQTNEDLKDSMLGYSDYLEIIDHTQYSNI